MRRDVALLCVALAVIALFSACSKPLEKMSADELLEAGEKVLSELDYERALIYFNRLIEVEPHEADGYLGAADVYAAEGNTEAAIGILEDGFRELPGDEGFLKDAVDFYETALEEDALLPEIHLALARAYGLLNETDRALEILADGYGRTSDPGLLAQLETLLPEPVVWAIDPVYEAVQAFSEERAAVSLDSIPIGSTGGRFSDRRWGFIDERGTLVIPCVYHEVTAFSNGLAAVRTGEKWGYINRDGDEVVPFIYDMALPFSEGLAAVVIGKTELIESGGEMYNTFPKMGYIDITGKEVIPFDYYYGVGRAYQFSEGLAAVSKTGTNRGGANWNFGYIDKSGKEIIPFRYHEAYPFSGGLARVVEEMSGNYGYIDPEGNTALPFIHDFIFAGGDFSEGLAAVQDESYDVGYMNKIGYMDKQGELVIPYQFDSLSPQAGGYAGSFVGGYALARAGTNGSDYVYGVTDTAGTFTSFQQIFGLSDEETADIYNHREISGPSDEALIPFLDYQGMRDISAFSPFFYEVIGQYGFIQNPYKYIRYWNLIAAAKG